MAAQRTFAEQAVLGGALIGIAEGAYMLAVNKVAGNSGALKTCVLPGSGGQVDIANIFFTIGLLVAGAVTSTTMPWAYEAYAPLQTHWAFYVFGGFSTGVGVVLQNGCTSGHGLAGLSRFSLRSLTAVPVFMVVAAFTASIKDGFGVGPMMPLAPTPQSHIDTALSHIAVVAALLVPLLAASCLGCADSIYKSYTGLIVGCTFGFGLALGGMVRPSAVTGALSPAKWDLTLWILFCTALAVTFVLYRVAEARGVKQSRHTNGPGQITTNLVTGAVLFGIGWGLTGLCPGPLLVGCAAEVFGGESYTGASHLTLLSVVAGMRVGYNRLHSAQTVKRGD